MSEKMSLQEAYKEMQQNCGIEVGDKVKVLRKAEDRELGWGANWVVLMDKMVGGTFKVSHVYASNAGIRLDGENDYKSWNFPFFVLEIVEKKPKTKVITINEEDFEVSLEEFKQIKQIICKNKLCTD